VTLALVIAGAVIGAPLRYLIDRAIQRRRGSVFPWGTFTVNVVGSFVLGFVAEAVTNDRGTAFLATGLCGAFTTYSTFAYETATLARIGSRLLALLNVVASIAAGVAAVTAGVAFGGWMTN
jgi:fluoride exporter